METVPTNCRPARNGFRRLATRILVSMALLVIAASCEKNPLQELPDTAKSLIGARLSSEPVFSASYEMETYYVSQVLSKGQKTSDAQMAFIEIAAQPRLDRQSVDFKLFADGSYEVTSVQMEPQRRELLPAAIREKKTETVLSYKTVIANNVARFYDKEGKETGTSQLKPARFTSLVNRIASSGDGAKEEVASEIMGHPLAKEAYILTMARDKQAEIKTKGAVTEIKFDLSRFASEANEPVENLAKYTVQYYDFKNNRMLGERLYDKKDDKLLYRSMILYNPVSKGNQVEKVLSETFEEDPKTGVKTRHEKQTFYSNMKIKVNI